MSADLPDHDRLRPTVLFYLAFVLLQIVTGAILFAEHIGFAPSGVLEYYRGSEKMLEVFAGGEDRFRAAKTWIGLIKIAIGHLAAYGVAIFILAHWLRSLRGESGSGTPDGPVATEKRDERLSTALFLTALADVTIAFPIAFGPDWSLMPLVYLRPLVFLAFEAALLLACVRLIAVLFAARTPEQRTETMS